MKSESKIRLLNALLASGSPFASDIFACASKGIEAALKDDSEKKTTEEFAREILRLYDASAHVEVLDFDGKDFDPLFAIPQISSAVRRLSGFPRAILVVSSLERAGFSAKKSHMGRRDKILYSENLEFLEDRIESYKKSFPNLEIFFI